MRASWIIHLVLCASLCCLASGPGDDGDGAPSRNSSQSDGEFYAWLVHPEHVFEANLMHVYPSVPEHQRVSRYAESGCESV